jgi:hypothetical protein
MAQADHIRVRRNGYWHHGIDCGDGTVIHYSGTLWRSIDAAIVRSPMAEFALGRPVEVVELCAAEDADAVLGRAMARLGEAQYHVVFNNCEHFAHWCTAGVHHSKQVRRAIKRTAKVAAAAVAVAALHVVRRRVMQRA